MAFGFGNPTLCTTAKGGAAAECLGRGKKRLRSGVALQLLLLMDYFPDVLRFPIFGRR